MNRATKSDSWVQNPDGTLGYTCSLITGCLMGDAHPYCFAKTLANGRLKQRYLANSNLAPSQFGTINNAANEMFDPFYPRFWADRLEKLDKFLTKSKKPVGVFLNIMGEWAGDWIPRAWQDAQFELINRHPGHRFYLLTHQPQNLPQWSPFPDHCYLGVTATNEVEFMKAIDALWMIEAKLRYISLEPLLGRILTNWHELVVKRIGWFIIGAMTGTKSLITEMAKRYPELTPMPYGKLWTLQPKIEWVEEIVKSADRAGVKVFLKDNLQPLYEVHYPVSVLRQELPKC